ncbi:2-amino-4-hydroxy-6-hydroxymethyldihydropteridine pyrophosphokinase [Actinomycetota bacterium]|nr:2-amino-4-hydroxy-6-hydroxymethyldihydropteridine pyrophosphokinase [Actinomycetota bacterium]
MSYSNAFIGVGSNLPYRDLPPLRVIQSAIKMLGQVDGIKVLKCATPITTTPINITAADFEVVPEFVNTVVQISTTLLPFELLKKLQQIEDKFARKRHANPKIKVSRTLDLDIILYGDIEINTPELTIPHPRYSERDFVMIPLGELKEANSGA